jgi:hypothetical protein
MNDDQDLLASAYLDGALTSDERARAEADPEVMAAVERLGELRRALAVVEPVDSARRDAAIQAALGAFDTERAPDAPAPAASLSRRRARGWWLSGAAAAAFVLIIAGAIIAGGDGDDDGGEDAGGAAVTELSEDATLTAADTNDGEQRAAEDATGGAAATTAAAAPAATEAPATSGALAEGTITATYSALLLTSPDDLTRFADDALRAAETSADAAVPNCDEGRWLGSATYVVDDVATPVEVFLADDDSEVLAVDASTCQVVARAPGP